MENDTRDRVIAMEVKLAHVIDLLEKQNVVIDEQNKKINQLFTFLDKASGAKWILAAMFFVASSIPAVVFNWTTIAKWFVKQ